MLNWQTRISNSSINALANAGVAVEMRLERKMTSITSIPITDWNQPCPGSTQQAALRDLESGNVLLFPQLPFMLDETEKGFLTPDTVGKSKNVSFDIHTGKLGGSNVSDAQLPALHTMMQRYAQYADRLVRNLLPHYQSGLIQGRTSFRPVEIAGRASSWRKDDTRLHVDAFPSAPVRGRRILRMFSNVNPEGKARSWRLGEPFEGVANRFMPDIPGPAWGSAALLELLHITKSRRSAYDHFMLQLHDRMKADTAYQIEVSQSAYDFPPGTTWMVFTDQVSHAVMTGQHLMEQTFYLPVEAMQDQSLAPLRVLERITQRELV
jgi:hypothetical protein